MTRKVGPPGWREHMMMDRVDGFVGDPSHMPKAIAVRIAAAIPPFHGRTEVEIIHARMIGRQMDLDFANKVRRARRKRFGLLTR
jgi:hypothetical protein